MSFLEDQWWEDQAACKGKPYEVFFPEQGASAATAKAICRRCAVRAECKLAHPNERFGVWWGTTQEERRGRIRVHR